MTKNVIKRASPISTCVGGTEGVPSACRRKESTTIIRVNEVTITRIAGKMDNNVIKRSNSSGVDIPKKLLPAAAGGAGAAKTPEGKSKQQAIGNRLQAKAKKPLVLCHSVLYFVVSLLPIAYRLSPFSHLCFVLCTMLSVLYDF